MIFIHIIFHENQATGPKFDVVERKTSALFLYGRYIT